MPVEKFSSATIKALACLGLIVLAMTLLIAAYSPGQPILQDLEDYASSPESGRYLALAANCNACHTVKGGAPFAGGLEFATPFGTLYSTNITQDSETGIGAWSFEDFYRAMKYGLRPNGEHLYPAFPYTHYAKMPDEDIAAIFKYMQTIGAANVENKTNKLNFPFSERRLLGPWKMLFHNAEEYSAVPEQSEQWNRGAYLVQGPAHCGACHSPRNVVGAIKPDLALSGGVYQDRVKFGYHRNWSAVNLTSAATGLQSWDEQDIVDYLQSGVSDKAIVHGPMRDVVFGSMEHLNQEDLKAIAVYLKRLAPIEHPAKPAIKEETLRAGEIVYTVHCGSCHLPTGLGAEGLGVSLAGNPIVQAADPASLINLILYGPHLPDAPFSVDRSNMKMFGKRLSDKDIAAAASYLRTSFGNRAGGVSPAQVKAQR